MKESTDGFSLEGSNSTYQLKGCEEIDGMTDEPLKGMIGKLVKVNGDFEKSEAVLLIYVKDIEMIN